jgi:hypothetical protein
MIQKIWRACAVAAALVASTVGCSGMKTSQSQLFGTQGNYQSASITYRIEQHIPPRAASGPAWVKHLALGGAEQPAERRIATLAVRYPHPAGRAGYARVECIIAAAPDGAVESSRLPGWLDRLGELADDGLPGISMAEGIHEAMGLDVPIGELDAVLARLEQTDAGRQGQPGGDGQRQVVQVSYAVNGAIRPPRSRRVAELDQLIARVRRDGSVISHSSSIVEPLVNPSVVSLASAPVGIPTASVPAANPGMMPAQPAAPAAVPIADGAIQPVGYAAPLSAAPTAMRRLPPVSSVQ